MPNIEIIVDAVDNASGPLSSIASLASGALSFAIGGVLKDAFDAATGALGNFFQQALDTEKQQTSLSAVIKSTGGAAGLTADSVNQLASNFRDLAGGSDEAIVSIEEIGIRSGQINANQMPQFIKNVTDLGTVMGDTSAAATLLARAQDDPEAAFKRIERATGAYDVALAAQIKTMQKSGDTAGATALIMQFVADKTGGAAAAAADTMSGRWDILSNHLQDAGKGVLEKLLPPLETLFDRVIVPAIPVVERLAGLLASQMPASFDQVRASVNQLLPPFQSIIDAVGNIMAAFQASMPMIQKTVQDMVNFVINQIKILSPTLIANVSDMLNQLAIFWKAHGDQIMAVVDFAFKFIMVTVGGALTLITGVITVALNLINGNWSGAWKAMQATHDAFWNVVLSLVGTNLDAFNKMWSGNLELVKIIFGVFVKFIQDQTAAFITVWAGNWDLVKTIFTTAWNGISGYIGGIIGTIVGTIQNGVSSAISIINSLISLINAIPGVNVGGISGPSSSSTTTTNTTTTNNFSFGGGTNDPATNMATVRALIGSY